MASSFEKACNKACDKFGKACDREVKYFRRSSQMSANWRMNNLDIQFMTSMATIACLGFETRISLGPKL